MIDRRHVAALVSGLAVVMGVAGCATDVQGTGTADAGAVSAYQSAVAVANAATAASVCADWNTGYTTRLVATKATVAFTDNSSWTWAGIIPLIDSEQTAITTENTALNGLVTRAAVKPDVQHALQDYQAKLTAYSAALTTDTTAKGTGTATWPHVRPASSALEDSADAVRSVCDL